MAIIGCVDWYEYAIHILLIGLFWLVLLKACYEILKRFKLKKRGNVTDGIVQSLKIQTQNERASKFFVCYQFNYNQHKAKSLVFGYIKNIYNQTPKALRNVILSFYDKHSFEATLTNTHQITHKLFETLNEGDTIKILYDPKYPNKFNIPQNEYYIRGGIYWMAWLIMACLIFIMALYGIEYGCMRGVSNNIAIQWMYSILFFVLCSVGIWTFFGLCSCCKLCRNKCRERHNTNYGMMLRNNLCNNV